MTLLIVEDEDIIRKGLIVIIRKLHLEFEAIYEARNGEEGIALCQEYTPDIIITDIKMPLMDGLTFISESKDFLPNSQYIILSGYSDFEYARTAIQYGVKDYLLKPSTKDEMNEVLSKVINQIQKEQSIQLEMTECLDSYQKKLDRFQELLLGNILIGKYTNSDISPCLLHYSIHFSKKLIMVICIKIIPAPSCDAASIDYKNHFLWFSDLLHAYGTIFQTDILSVYKVILFNLSSKELTMLYDRLPLIQTKINDYEQLHELQMHFSLSKADSNVNTLPSLYEEAYTLLHYRLFEPNTIFWDPKKDKHKNAIQPTIPLTMIETIYHNFLGSSQFDLRQSFLSFIRHILKVTDTSPNYLISCIHKLEEYFTVRLTRDNPDSENTYEIKIDLLVQESLTTSDTITDFSDVLCNRLLYFWNLRKEGSSPAVHSVSSPIDYAISYMEQNYYMDLNLGIISDLIFMNSSYFSSLFKKKTGLNFIHYLQNIRIEKSKKLLLNTNQKLYEIAEAVGISNVKYFCKLFKEYTSVTPSEYRRG